MRHVRIFLGATVVFTMAVAVTADAQTPPAPRARARRPAPTKGYLSINGGAQLARTDFQTNVEFPYTREQGEFDASYEAPAAPALDVGAGVRIWQRLAVGAAVTYTQVKGLAAVDARVPHPFSFGADRTLDDSVPDLFRAETAVHIQAAWLAPVAERVSVSIFGGPTIFRVEQDIITGLDFEETYPFDDVTLDEARIARREDTAIGFHVGADVMYRMTRSVGVGAVARYSRGTLTVATDGAQQADLTAGGLLLSGGIRWFF
jgi:hypothetical protein